MWATMSLTLHVPSGLSQQVVFRCHGILRSLVGKLGASSPGEQVLRSFEAIFSRLVRRSAAGGRGALLVVRRTGCVTGLSPCRGDRHSRKPAVSLPSASSRHTRRAP